MASLIDSPTAGPIFFEPDTRDKFIAATMRSTGAQALVVVPIVSHERFYGVLNVSVTERPERLKPTSELRGLLAGVVAQAATALDNARLIETMAHQARFDSLTGLLGHRAFHEALEIQLERHGSPFTLAAIDIDDFKLVNDLHGHPVGDEALRRVAEALRGSVREQDAVFPASAARSSPSACRAPSQRPTLPESWSARAPRSAASHCPGSAAGQA